MQTIHGMQTQTTTVWEPDYRYMAVAAIVTALAIMTVVASFDHFWLLGRKVSLSPLEVSKALGSPLLADADGNASAKDPVKGHGSQSAVYGMVAMQDLGFDPSVEVTTPRRRGD